MPWRRELKGDLDAIVDKALRKEAAERYPSVDLTEHKQDLHWYLRRLEAGLIGALGGLGIEAGPNPGLTGVWTGGRKIASIGIHVKQWVTFHGFALNVNTDLSYFDLIVPCGIRDVIMTSVSRELARSDSTSLWVETWQAVIDGIADALDREPAEMSASHGFK